MTFGARLWGQPFRVGPGLVQAGFHTSGQGVGEHERGGGLEFATEQIGRAGRLEAQGPPVLAAGADLAEFHRAPGLAGQPRAARRGRSAGQREPADAPRLADRLPAGRVADIGAGRAAWKGPLLPGLDAATGADRHLLDGAQDSDGGSL